MTDYSKMTQEDFDYILFDLIAREDPTFLATIPGVYEILSEYYNNDVLSKWAEEQEEEQSVFEEDEVRDD